jgi:YVTN family beta-propeller protein
VTNQYSNSVSVIDTATNDVIATVEVGNYPSGIAVSPDGTKVYVTNQYSNSVSVIDTATNSVTSSVAVGLNPNAFGQFICSSPESVFPEANFSSNVTEGYIPLAVQFTDLSQNATGWYWDFGDGNNSTDQNPTHLYSTAGNYTIYLTVSNSNSTSSKDAIINILRATPIITWSNPANLTYGIELNSTQLNAVSSVPGTFNYTLTEGTILSAGDNQNLHVEFTPTDIANYTNASKDVTINVSQANPTIIWNSPVNITYGTPLNDTQLNATATSVNGDQLD